jgi:hypothetical protein
MPPTKKPTRALEATTPNDPQLTTEIEDTPFTEEPMDREELNVQLQAAMATIKRLEALAQRQSESTPSSTDSTPLTDTRKSTKLPDPPALSDGKDPTFESWELAIHAKLEVNEDHYRTERARKAYIFGRTVGDAQMHLQPRYNYHNTVDPYLTAQDMIEHLASIYDDPYKTQNARSEYRSLSMKPSQTFTEFYTRFLHLAGRARIPILDWQPDLYYKLTTKLQKSVLPKLDDFTTHGQLAAHCTRMDQGLKRIADREERYQRNPRPAASPPATRNEPKPNTARGSLTPSRAATPPAPSRPRVSFTPAADRIRPKYDDLHRQELSRLGACFGCGQPGHMVHDCPHKIRSADVKNMEPDPQESATDEESEKEES